MNSGVSNPASNSTSHTTIYLLRHGAIQPPGGGKRYIGSLDLALSRSGLDQARIWARYFSDAGLDEIYCSDLSRCLETARIIGARCALAPRPVPELREISLGSWEGRRFETIKSRYPHEFEQRGAQMADHRPPGGESFRDLLQRSWPIFAAAARGEGTRTLMVTHAGVIRVILCRILGMPLENLFSIGQDYGALNVVGVRRGTCRVQALNLPTPATQADRSAP